MATVPPGDTPGKRTHHAASSCLSELHRDLKHRRRAGRSEAPEQREALRQDGYVALTMKAASCCVIVKTTRSQHSTCN